MNNDFKVAHPHSGSFFIIPGGIGIYQMLAFEEKSIQKIASQSKGENQQQTQPT